MMAKHKMMAALRESGVVAVIRTDNAENARRFIRVVREAKRAK